MPKYDDAILRDKDSGSIIQPGQEVIDFRGDKAVFLFVSKLPVGNSGGKIIIGRPCTHTKEHYWCRCADNEGLDQRECNPSVINAMIEE
ncbi:hypothetical protein ACH427_04490 [Streptomyces sp. NPDC020379]|uniref:hypothetical protein n=1 Tax=Streptomyces sp. NPDC020379 TaxID=3365071 RepID=UPI00378AD85B